MSDDPFEADFLGCEINELDRRLLSSARNGKTDEVKKALDEGADRDILSRSGYSALHHSIYSSNVATCKLLLDNGYDVNSVSPGDQRATPLDLAAFLGYANMVQFLLDNGADPDGANIRQRPIDIALKMGRADVVAILEKQPTKYKPDEPYRGREYPGRI